MEKDFCEEALGIEVLLGEILMRLGCTKSLFRSSLVKRSWLSTVKSQVVVSGFASRNRPSFLGFIIQYKGVFAEEIKLISPAGVPANDSAWAMRSRFDADALSGFYVLGSHGGRLISWMEVPGAGQGGIYISCPYANPTAYTLVGFPVPPIERTPAQHTPNTYGQFAVLYRTGEAGSCPVGFFVKDAAGLFDRLYQGVRFRSDSKVFVHVCVFRNEKWTRFVSDALVPPPLATFHRNPYCVQAGSTVYMMYLVGFIVCFDIELLSFGVLDLPGEMATTVKSWFDYTVGPHPEGDLAVVHADNGTLMKWVLTRKQDGVDWQLETSVDLEEASADMINRCIPTAFLAEPQNLDSLQVRCVSPDARFVLISIGLNQGLFTVDLLEKKVSEVPNVVEHGVLGRVFPLCEDWPPKPSSGSRVL